MGSFIFLLCMLQLAILEAEQKAEEEEEGAESSSRKRGKKKTKYTAFQ